MPEIEYREEGRKLTPSDIDEVETKLSFKFPEQFRSFYLAHNGGMPLPNFFEGRRGISGERNIPNEVWDEGQSS